MPDGKLREIKPSDLVPGAVIREIAPSTWHQHDPEPEGPDHDAPDEAGNYEPRSSSEASNASRYAVSPAFPDVVVVQVSPGYQDPRDDDDQWVTLKRPFFILHGRVLYMAAEEFMVPAKRLCGPDSIFRLVCLDSGTPVNIRS